MKKLLSLIFAFSMVFIMAITAFGAEDALRLFTVSPDEKNTDEIIGYALEKGFDGIAVDLRGEDSLSFYKKLSSAVISILPI